MKAIFSVVLSVVVTLAFCRPSYATECATDIDCNMYENERCVVPAYSNRGVCTSVKTPQRKDFTPASPPPSSPSLSPVKRGKFCMTNSDCDPGQTCTKKNSDDVYGKCF